MISVACIECGVEIDVEITHAGHYDPGDGWNIAPSGDDPEVDFPDRCEACGAELGETFLDAALGVALEHVARPAREDW